MRSGPACSTSRPNRGRGGHLVPLLLTLVACGQLQQPRALVPLAHLQALTPISEVQGNGAESPIVDRTVTVQGIVVADFQGRDELRGFFLQETQGDDRDDTSDGIFVFDDRNDVAVGNEVRVTGRVEEYYGLTEITGVESLTTLAEAPLPEPVTVSLPLPEGSDWEQYEGMYVRLESGAGALVAAEVYHLGRGGLVMLADERLRQFSQENQPSPAGYAEHLESLQRRTILLDDGTTKQNPDPVPYSTTGRELTADDTLRVGDETREVTGVITYSYSGWRGTDAYRIHPTKPVDFVTDNPRPRQPPEVGGSVQVASFNVLNFFNGDGQGGGFPTTRGADSAFELQRQLDKLVSAMVPLDAEVLGFIEIENDSGPDSALADLVDALNDRAGAGTYAFVESGVLGGDEIKVALAYQPAAVKPVGPSRVLNSTLSDARHTLEPRFDDTRNRPALAQTFVEVASGARFTVVVNHLKSKGGSCRGDPDRQDGQGNCNETRREAAEALVDWSRQLAKWAGDPDVLIMGDLNAYAREDPVRALLAGGFENLLGAHAPTYVFKGESGTLDYALASPELAGQVSGTGVWHINAEEPSVLDYNAEFKSERHVELLYSDSPYRSSDHDPILVGLDLEPGKR